MGKAAIVSKPLGHVAKKLAKHTPLDEVAQKIAPDLYHLITGEQVLSNMKARSKAHPGYFSNDFQGAMQTGRLKEYVNGLPDHTKENLTGYYKGLDPDNQADFTDLLGRAANQEPDALHGIHMADKTLTLEKTYQANNKRYNNIPQQPTETAVAPEAPSPKEKQIRQQSTERFDRLNEIVQGEEQWAELRQQGREDHGLVEDRIDGQGQNVHSAQRFQGYAPHHLSEKAFDEKAIRNWPEEEQVQFIRDMNSIDVFPGNHPRNWIGLFHDNTLGLLNQKKLAVQRLWKEAKLEPPSKRQLDDWFKADAHSPDKASPEYSRVELESSEPEIQAGAKADLSRGTIKRDWSEILPPGKTIQDIEAVQPIVSRDHQEFVHGIVNKLPSTKRIKELIASGEWDAIPYIDRMKMLMRNAVEKQNVAFNVALMRINLIRKAMGKPNASWENILTWIAKDPKRAASIGWHEQVSRGGDLYNQLKTTPTAIIEPLSKKDLQLVGNVFGMSEVPDTTAKFQQWLKQNG